MGIEADFLNDYFIKIIRNLDIPANDDSNLNVYNVGTSFFFSDDIPTEHEIVKIIKDLNVNKSSCVDNINARFCKESMLAVSDKICSMKTKSLANRIIPTDWCYNSVT